MYKFKIITTQPGIFNSFLETGLICRGIAKKIIDVQVASLYDFATDQHRSIDDSPYGGGPGMILKVDVIDKALKKNKAKSNLKTILLTPQGEKFNQKMAKSLSQEKGIILISGRFEGFDERIRALVDKEISIGDYVLSSGDLPAMVLIDAISRQVPGYIAKEASIKEESFEQEFLEYPQYTRPFEYKGAKVPEILISGNHAEIAQWRKNQAQKRTENRLSGFDNQKN